MRMPLACERVKTYRVCAFTLFPEIPWRVTNVFTSVYANEELFNSFLSSSESIGVSGYDDSIIRSAYRELLTKLCRTRVKSFMQGLKEEDLETDKKVCDVDSSLRDKLKGYVMTCKR